MDSCSLFLLLSTFFGGYDLYRIVIMSPLELERAPGPKGRRCEYCVKSLLWFLVLQLYRTEVHSLLIPEHINGRFLISFLSCLKSVSKARMSTLKTPRGKGNTQKTYSKLSLVNFHEAQTLTVRLVSFGNIRRDSMSSWIFPTSVNFSSSK